jgi:hypothetical protein
MGLRFVTVGFVCLLGLGCAGRTEPIVLGPPDEPRASWVLKAGAEYGAEREVCRSDRLEPCVIPAGSGKEPTSAVVSVYLYPAGDQPTTYKGALLSSFMGSTTGGHETPVDVTLKPGERPGFIASVGRVKPVPGDYEIRMAFFAEVPGHNDPHQFQQIIPIRVVAAASPS